MFADLKHWGRRLAIAVAIGLVGSSAALAGKPVTAAYTIVPFISPFPAPTGYNSDDSRVEGLNGQGHAVGGETFRKQLPDGSSQMVYQALHLDIVTGTYTLLQDGYIAAGVDNFNQIAGTRLSDGRFVGAFWKAPAAAPVDLPPLRLEFGHTQSVATAINDAGIVVGYSYNDNASSASGVVWIVEVDEGGDVSVYGPWALPPLAGDALGEATDLSEAADSFCEVTGCSFTANERHAVVWTVTVDGISATPGPAVNLAGDNTWSFGYGVNLFGDVCGMMGVSNQEMPFLAPAGQTAQLLPVPRNTQWGRAYDINNLGEIVGQLDIYKISGVITGPGNYHPYLWKNGKMIDLETQIDPESGWARLWGATVINDAGVIAGHGRLDIEHRGFLLIPVAR